MECSLSFCYSLPFSSSFLSPKNLCGRNGGNLLCMIRNSASSNKASSEFSYKKFIDFALDETKMRTPLIPSPLQDKFSSLLSMDGKTKLQMLSFESPKVRFIRSLFIEGSDGMQVLDLAVFPRQEFDLPIFCANFFTTGSTDIVVLDLNPLHDVISEKDYKDKYYKNLLPLATKYTKLLPWGGKITGESLSFFSPIVIWSKFSASPRNYSALFSAFRDYYTAWLLLMDQATAEVDSLGIARNREAQHRYLTWRAEKDPGRRLLRKLIGETQAEEIVDSFLFNGVMELGSKTFLDYFPQYRSRDGTVNDKRSIIGKSYENRPWNVDGEFLANGSE